MKRALITGANRGLGLALARAWVERGLWVFAGARQPDRASELERLKEAHPEGLQVVCLDVTDAESVRKSVEAVGGGTNRLDILVNNAAVFIEEASAGLAALDVEWFTRTIAVNLTGVARVTQAFLPLLLASSNPRIVNLSSGAGSIRDKRDHRYYCYGASKAALNHFTVGLAHELRPRNVIVSAISPGWVRTDMGGENAELSPEESAGAMAETILNLTTSDSGCFLSRHGRRGEYAW